MVGTRMTRRLRPRVLGMVFLILIVVVPIPKSLIQEWSVRVIDQDGVSVAGTPVSESWENYTFGISGGTTLYTNSEGTVVFPSQRYFRPIAYWFIKAVANVLGFGVHAGFGSVGRVWISDPRPKEVTTANCSNDQCTAQRIQSELRVVWR